MLTIYCDGGARGNPGPAASAVVVVDGEKVIAKKSKYLGVATNNVAEYNAVILGLQFLNDNLTESATFVLDSLLVASQLQGKFKIKNENLLKLFTHVKQIEKSLDTNIFYTHVLRHKNALADELVNQTLDENS